YYPASSPQKRLFVLQCLEEKAPFYNMPLVMALETRGGKRVKKDLERAFKKLVRRHESFRTCFEMAAKEPVQRVHDTVPFETVFTGIDATGEPTEEIVKSFVRPFDLSRAPLIRIVLLYLWEHRFILMVDMHHIITDALSQAILVREFTTLYNEPGKEPNPLRIQYKDYAVYQQHPGEKERLNRQETYWLDEFRGEIPVLDLPMDFSRPAVQAFDGDSVDFYLQDPEKLTSLAKETGTTLFMFTFALFNILLAKLTGQEDIIVGTPVAARRHPDLEPIVGFFVNTLAPRNNPTGEKPFKAFLQEVKEKLLKAYENQEYPFEKLVEQLPVQRDTGRNPIFDVSFTLDNIDNPVPEPGDLKINPYNYDYKVTKFDLMLTGIQRDGQLFFSFAYSTKIFRQETIHRFVTYFQTITAAAVEEPGKTISQLEILSSQEKNRVLNVFNNVEADYPKDKTIHELFAQQVKKRSDGVAVVGRAQGGPGGAPIKPGGAPIKEHTTKDEWNRSTAGGHGGLLP
ncbi:MAG: non-ribosomal peptide synthetase, partial [bacterium]|nr:non-ribosomal peptide synthetase [bacterium]